MFVDLLANVILDTIKLYELITNCADVSQQ